jgi:hypothetical protein
MGLKKEAAYVELSAGIGVYGVGGKMTDECVLRACSLLTSAQDWDDLV